MISLAESLKTRYEIAKDSVAPNEFYLNVYRYIDFIEETSQLSDIVDDEQAGLKSGRTSMILSFAILQAKIYKYIYWYENPDERGSDPIGDILVEGITPDRLKKLSKDDQRIIERDYTQEKLATYKSALRQLHLKMIERLEDSNPGIKVEIIMDGNKGIYRKDNDLTYPIERNSKRAKLIDCLFSTNNVSLANLENETAQKKDVVIKSINQINKLFRQNLKLPEDLILSVPTGGYSLNKDKFNFLYKEF